ncbi:uncharacterized protein LOC117644219 [Thrips palmi]|uniref:Uncharacterized protein LOC117644219 n=1 Tax=Thrips palmi TaxID=161013 RepID=A0A6P8YHW3_THRPL|nr:uncharacterized protein LOC117644219 [Thrips palmi]
MPASRRWLLAVLLNVLISVSSPRRQASGRLFLRVLLLENCDGPPLPIRFVDRKISWIKDLGHVVDATVSVSKSIASFRMVFVELKRCRDPQRLDVCEYYATWSWRTAICNLVVMPGMIWTPILHSISPPIKCPLKAGTYHAVNSTWDLNSALMKEVLEDGMVWKGDVVFADPNNASAGCLRGAIQGVKRNFQ